MTMMFGADFLSYEYDKKRNCHVQDEDLPQFVYDMEEWVSTYNDMINENETVKGDISCLMQLLQVIIKVQDNNNASEVYLLILVYFVIHASHVSTV